MLIWDKKIPEYLLKKDTVVRTTLYTALFALAFINIYTPFSAEKKLHLNNVDLLLNSSLAILAGMIIIVVSRIVMYKTTKKNSLTYLYYSLWIFAEILSMAAGYSVYVKYVLKDVRILTEIVQVTIRNTALILLLPYSVLWLYFAYREKTKQLEEYSHGHGPKPDQDKMIPFYDDKGKLKFSVVLDDLIYIEASDNYVSIYYSTNKKLSKFMIRNTLKTLEEKLQRLGFLRCHRSYLVNFSKVKILKREKDGVFLELNTEDGLTLPVSKTYVSAIVQSFSDDYI
jgi:hypothetical protein